MKAVPLLLLALLLAAPSRALTPADAADQADSFAARDKLLAEIDSWRALHLSATDASPDIITRLRPRLSAIRTRVKESPDETALLEPSKDFEAWKKDLLHAKDARNAAQGMRTYSFADFVYDQSAVAHIVADQRFQLSRQRAAVAARGAGGLFFDGAATGQDSPVWGSANTNARNTGTGGAPSHVAGLHINPAPAAAPPVTTAALSWDSLSGFFDVERGRRAAREVVDSAKGYVKRCYAYVKQALIDADILDVPDRTQTSGAGFRPGMAKMFAEDANRNPKVLAKLGYRRVDTKTIVGNDPSIIPDGTILNYAAGCAGFSKTAGHIELTASREMLALLRKTMRKKVSSRLDDDQVLACSDGCSGRTLNFIRTYGKKGCLNMYVPVRSDR